MALPITLSNATIAADAPSGAIIGTFNTPGLRFAPNGNPYGWFLISGQSLLVAWNGQAMSGQYTIQVHAPGGEPAPFTITLTPAAVPFPASLVLTPPSVTLPDSALTGTKLCSFAVMMSDGSPFAGTVSASPSGMVAVADLNITLARALTTPDDGAHTFAITATQNGKSVSANLTLTVTGVALPSIQINGSTSPVTASAGATISATVANGSGNPSAWLGVYAVTSQSGPGDPASWKWLATDDARGSVPPAPGVTAGTVHLVVPNQAGQYEVRFFPNSSFNLAATSAAITIQITAPPPVPTSVTLTPASVSLPDNSPAGTPVSKVAVAMSGGAIFAGTLTIGANNMVALAGSAVNLARAMTAADDGAHSFLITATQNAGTASAALALNVSAGASSPTPVITFSPIHPQIPDTTPKGAAVATYAVAMSDGSPFVGTIGFGPPNGDSGGTFALHAVSPSKGEIIVNPAGPGVGPNLSTITDHVTLVATQ